MKRLLILLLVAGIFAAGFFGYKHFFQTETIAAWSLVPDNALIVYETDQFASSWETLKDKKTWKTLSAIPAINQLNEDLSSLDSTQNGVSLIDVLTEENKLLIGLFPVNRSELGALYILEIKNINQHAALSNLLEENYSRKSRKYNGFTITEITHKQTERKLTFIFYKNFFIGSTTPFLVEDAIRTINESDYLSFKDVNPELFKIARLQNDDGNLYFNASRADDLAGLFYKGAKNQISFLKNIASSSFLDLATTESEISLNGFSIAGNEDTFLDIFKGNPSTSFTVANLISNDAYALNHLSFTNSKSFLERLSNYRQKHETEYQAAKQTLEKYDINPIDFSNWMGDELAFYETNYQNGQFAIIKTNDIAQANKQLKDISKRLATAKQDSVYSEVYDGFEITFFPLTEFPSLIFGNMTRGFEDVFYINYDNWLIFSNDFQNIKNLIDDIRNENTWGKSLTFNQYLELINKEANLSYIINTKNALRTIRDLAAEEWKDFLNRNEQIIKEFELAGIQFSNIDDKYFTNVDFFHPGEYVKRQGSTTLQSEISLTFEGELLGKPKIVRNHTNNSREIILQDSTNKLYLLSNEFDIIWIDSVSQRVTTDFSQVDFYKNNKLQLLFGSDNKVFLIDRNGQNVEKYPVEIGSAEITSLNVVDYNKTKKYRWAITNSAGELYLLDKKGKQLKNWSPNKKKYRNSSGINHTRILGKDLMLICKEDGVVDILNRQGNSYPGFPMNFEKDIDDQYILKPGTSFNKSSLTLIAKDGEVISVNLRGKFLKRDQLILGSESSTYSFVKDVSSNKYIIAVVDERKISLLSSDGNKKFEKDYINSGDLRIQYYNFGPGNELVIITDQLQEFSYLYDGDGNLINSIPLENSHELSVLYSRSRNEFEVFTSFHNRLDKYRFSLK
ncbi:MAG: hypothetical protein AAFQ94_08460 [Bacteroidota bacterium]